MSTSVYSIGTWDGEIEAYTPQEGLSVPCINVPLATMRQVLRELRNCGYDAHRIRGADGNHDCNDASVLVERTDGMSDAEVLASWDRTQWTTRILEEINQRKEAEMNKQQTWYCVILVGSHRQLYLGKDEDEAAEQLEPGTCFGSGLTQDDAYSAAVRAAMSIKAESRYKLIDEPIRKYAGPRNVATKFAGN